MGIDDVLQQMGGNVDKAILFIRKDREKDEKGNNASGKGLNSATSMASLKNNLKNKEGKASEKKKEYLDGIRKNYHAFKVQYNPSSIRLNNVAGTTSVVRGAGEGGNKTVEDIVFPPQTIMDVELVFQDVNPVDAFGKNGFEKIAGLKNNLSVSGIYQTVKAAKSKYSVQEQVEALLSIITDVDTAKVIFHWAEFDFEGVVNSVRVTYTMFSNAGRPIAARVSLSMKNTDNSEADADANGAVENPNDKYWNEAYKNLFKNKSLAGKREDGDWFDSIGNW